MPDLRSGVSTSSRGSNSPSLKRLSEFQHDPGRFQRGVLQEARQPGIQAHSRGKVQRHHQMVRQILRGGHSRLKRRELQVRTQADGGGIPEPGTCAVAVRFPQKTRQGFGADDTAAAEIVDWLESRDKHARVQDRFDSRLAIAEGFVLCAGRLLMFVLLIGTGPRGGLPGQRAGEDQVLMECCFRVSRMRCHMFPQPVPDLGPFRIRAGQDRIDNLVGLLPHQWNVRARPAVFRPAVVVREPGTVQWALLWLRAARRWLDFLPLDAS